MIDYVMTGASADELWPLVRDFHYSSRMPSAIRNCFAVREPGGLFGDTRRVVAGAIFGQPVQMNWNQEARELLRLVRRDDLNFPLSQLVSYSLQWLKGNTTVPFALSYADTAEGHHGGIYQSTNWRYVGQRKIAVSAFLLPNGEKKHPRQVNRELGSCGVENVAKMRPDWKPIKGEPKHLYIYPLRQKWPTIARKYGWEAKPYPKPDNDYAARLLDNSGTTGSKPGANPGGRSNTSQDAA